MGISATQMVKLVKSVCMAIPDWFMYFYYLSYYQSFFLFFPREVKLNRK